MIRIILSIILLGGGISLIRSTVGQGTDFLVFWKTGRFLLEGVSFYDLARDGGMVFKYPPWIAPLFIPFSFFSFEVGKWMWGIFSTLCLFGIFAVLIRRLKISEVLVAGLGVFYWGLWVIQALDGQVVVPLLFFALLYVTQTKASVVGASILPILFSTKIFTELPVLVRAREFLKPRVIGWGAAILIALTILSAGLSFHGNVLEMFQAWMSAASSGATFLNTGQTHGPKNQSLSILFCRIVGISADRTQIEILISLTFYAVFVLSQWKKLSKMDRIPIWFLMLAITPVFHPLPWHHLHVFSFPLAALFLSQWKRMKSPLRWGGLFAIALIALSAKRAWVFGLGEWLEYGCGRAWGGLVLTLIFLRLNPSLQRGRAS